MSKLEKFIEKYGAIEGVEECYVKDTLHICRGFTLSHIVRQNEYHYLEVYKNGVCIVRFIDDPSRILKTGLELTKSFEDLKRIEKTDKNIYDLLEDLYVTYQYRVHCEYNQL